MSPYHVFKALSESEERQETTGMGAKCTRLYAPLFRCVVRRCLHKADAADSSVVGSELLVLNTDAHTKDRLSGPFDTAGFEFSAPSFVPVMM
jgi:hypothetical protein